MEYDLDLSLNGYARLCTCLNYFVNRMRNNRRSDGTCVEFWSKYGTSKNIGKKIRNGLLLKRKKTFDIKNQLSINTFMRLTGLQIDTITPAFLTKSITMWNVSGIFNRTRVFIFKFYNNILGLNSRVSHFVPNVNRACTFCDCLQLQNKPDETFLHLFFTCQTSRDWQTQFLSKYFDNTQGFSEAELRKFWFLGYLPNQQNVNIFITGAALLFQFCIWEAKLGKKTPPFISLDHQFRDLFRTFLSNNRYVRKGALKINCELSRSYGFGARPQEAIALDVRPQPIPAPPAVPAGPALLALPAFPVPAVPQVQPLAPPPIHDDGP